MSLYRLVVPVLSVVLLAAPLAAQTVTPVPPAQDRQSLLKQAAADLAAGRRSQAAQLLRAAADRFQSVGALLQLAEIQSGSGDRKGAFESLGRARTLAPNAERVLYSFAQHSLADHALVPAIGALDPLTRMHPSVAAYHRQLGTALAGSGDLPAAIASLTRAEELEPNDASTLVALGTALNGRELYADARPPLLRGLALEPDNVDAAAALAESEAGLGDLQAAEAHAQRALVRSSAQATATLAMGMVRLRQGRYDEARDLLEKAATANPESAKAHEQLASAYAALGDETRAERQRDVYRQMLNEIDERVRVTRGRPEAPGTRPDP